MVSRSSDTGQIIIAIENSQLVFTASFCFFFFCVLIGERKLWQSAKVCMVLAVNVELGN